MSKYLNRLNENKDEAAKKANTLAEANAKAQVEQKISGLKAQAATLTAAYDQALGANPFNVDKVFSLTAEIEQNKKNVSIAEAVLSTEFSS